MMNREQNTGQQAKAAGAEAPPQSVGAVLRHRRAELGLSLDEVSRHLHIRQSHLEALERNDFDALPGRPYVIGFMKAYAAFMGLDGPGLALEYCKNHQKDPTEKLYMPQVRDGDAGHVSWPALLLVGCAFLGLAYGGWYFFNPSPQVAQGVVSDTVAAANGPDDSALASAEGPVASPASPVAAHPVPAAASQANPSGLPPENGTAPLFPNAPTSASNNGSNGVSASDIQKAKATADRLAGDQSGAANQTGAMADTLGFSRHYDHFTLEAHGRSWVSVRDKTGHVRFAHVMHKGEHWVGPAEGAPYTIRAANGSQFTLKAGGADSTEPSTAPLTTGASKRRLILTAEAIENGTLQQALDEPATTSTAAAVDEATNTAATAAAVSAESHMLQKEKTKPTPAKKPAKHPPEQRKRAWHVEEPVHTKPTPATPTNLAPTDLAP
ncbi:DUF4115 domain-containing protein [Formicincola oecophyllae]|uniref:DUF4115 domain-containing protein n=1 Tax=Formicincola oecophyllae TaxID=2558361 RepID=A0A4Y6U989_9PROT|nr:helix-turn-helix domain-containing protein [Formicincola oecophyllae]QDH12941.1 DUF4115 domain-containing protein [Formicincola oecophyllae]